jgi:hypothetical protein
MLAKPSKMTPSTPHFLRTQLSSSGSWEWEKSDMLARGAATAGYFATRIARKAIPEVKARKTEQEMGIYNWIYGTQFIGNQADQ